MTTEQNKAVVRRFISDLVVDGNWGVWSTTCWHRIT
jgi:hypothetical protein